MRETTLVQYPSPSPSKPETRCPQSVDGSYREVGPPKDKVAGELQETRRALQRSNTLALTFAVNWRWRFELTEESIVRSLSSYCRILHCRSESTSKRAGAVAAGLAGLSFLSVLAISSPVSAQGTRPAAASPATSQPASPQSTTPIKDPTYAEPQPYRPCPSSVVTPGGRHECMGCPGDCSRASAFQETQ
jgi:hypothetical protein